IPALTIGFFQDPILAIWVAVITLIAQQTDSNLITPNVMGKTLNIHPLTIITVLLAAGNIAGLVGILLGIPAYAVIKTVVSNIYDRRIEIKNAATQDAKDASTHDCPQSLGALVTILFMSLVQFSLDYLRGSHAYIVKLPLQRREQTLEPLLHLQHKGVINL